MRACLHDFAVSLQDFLDKRTSKSFYLTSSYLKNNPHILLTMPPTERSVLKHVSTVREALETLIDVQKKGTPRVIHCSLVEVINFTVRLYSASEILILKLMTLF